MVSQTRARRKLLRNIFGALLKEQHGETASPRVSRKFVGSRFSGKVRHYAAERMYLQKVAGRETVV